MTEDPRQSAELRSREVAEPDITGYASGECLYLQDADNMRAWIEAPAVHLGDWR